MKLPADSLIALEKLTRRNQFGDYFEICGPLRGPNGVTLRVKTIWIRDALSNAVRLVTLIPDKTRSP